MYLQPNRCQHVPTKTIVWCENIKVPLFSGMLWTFLLEFYGFQGQPPQESKLNPPHKNLAHQSHPNWPSHELDHQVTAECRLWTLPGQKQRVDPWLWQGAGVEIVERWGLIPWGFSKSCAERAWQEKTHTLMTHLQAHTHIYTHIQSATGLRVDQWCRCSMRCEMKIHWTSLNRTYFWNQSLILATWVSLSLILGIGAVRSSIYFEFRLMNRSKHNLFTVGLPLQSEQAIPICAFPFNNHGGGKWVSLQHLLPLWYNSLTHFEAHQPYLGSFSMFKKKHGETEI